MGDDILSSARRAMRAGNAGESMAFGIFSPSRVDEFARSLAQSVVRRYPPAVANNPDQAVSQNRVAEILDRAFADAHEFRVENKLGLFGRAKLGNTFKWELREFGYEEKFVDFAIGKLSDRLTSSPE
jgi:hypothetical protein